MKKILKRILISILAIFVILVGAIWIYSLDSSEPLDEMYDAIETLDTSSISIQDNFDHISYKVDDPIKNIVIVPGGKVEPESYAYLAINLALESYDVTIVKTLFNLAILTPNYGARFLSTSIDNVVIGHSLGGTVGSIFSEDDMRVAYVVFLSSYSVSDLKDKNVLAITAENDQVLDQEAFEDAKSLLPPTPQTRYEVIEGGNHGQFGWYGIQNGDGEATITTKEQQDQVIELILDFLI